MNDEIPDQLEAKDMWVRGEQISFRDYQSILGRGGVFPTLQWRKGEFSIIEPCEITFGQYELYPVDGNDVMRFDTLQEAKDYVDKLPNV